MAQPISADKTYRVFPLRPFEVSPRIWVRPGDGVLMKGDRLEQHKDKVERYEEV